MGCQSRVQSSSFRSLTVKSTPGVHAGDLRPAGVRSSPSPPGFAQFLRSSGGVGLARTPRTAGSGIEVLPPVRKPCVLELFCGTAGVFAAMQKRSYDVLGMDHKLKPRSMKASAVRVDCVMQCNRTWSCVRWPGQRRSGSHLRVARLHKPDLYLRSGKGPVPLRSDTPVWASEHQWN